MTQVIGDVMIIQLTPEEKAKSLIELIAVRYDKQIADNALLRLELERIREEQRIMSFRFPG